MMRFLNWVLLLKTEDEFINPFVPSWLRRVRAALKFPSVNMIYLVADAKHASGQQWLSPYNERVTMISLNSNMEDAGWKSAQYQFDKPIEVVGIWLMADGDDTRSKFTTEIRNIQFLN